MEIRGRLPGGSITTISDVDVEMMQAILAKFGARVGALGSPFGKCAMNNPEELAQHQRYFDRMIELAVAWDVNNGEYCGEAVLAEGYPLIRGRVRHVHVKPNKEKHMDTVAGSDVTYEAVFRALLADGYNGAASIEHWGSPELMLRGVG